MAREEKVALVEAYLKGLAGKDLSKVPFAVDVTFEGPLVPPLGGREAVAGFLTMILPAIQDVRIGEHLVEGEYVATTFDMAASGGINRVFDRICIADGEIRSIRSFYYRLSKSTGSDTALRFHGLNDGQAFRTQIFKTDRRPTFPAHPGDN